jgi:hypothetical protein
MRGHFLYLRFKTFSMTLRTPQCKVFWPLLSNSKHSGVPEDSKSPTLEVLGFTPTLGQSGVATQLVIVFHLTITLCDNGVTPNVMIRSKDTFAPPIVPHSISKADYTKVSKVNTPETPWKIQMQVPK